MGTTTETRITSTQAKDAIYKAHSISSSAIEIDDSVNTSVNKTLLNAIKNANSMTMIGDSILMGVGVTDIYYLWSQNLKKMIAKMCNITTNGFVSANDTYNGLFEHIITLKTPGNWTKNHYQFYGLNGFSNDSGTANEEISFSYLGNNNTAKIHYTNPDAISVYEVYINGTLNQTITTVADGVAPKTSLPITLSTALGDTIKVKLISGTISINGIEYLDSQNTKQLDIFATGGRDCRGLTPNIISKYVTYDVTLFCLGYNDVNFFLNTTTIAETQAKIHNYVSAIKLADKTFIYVNFAWDTTLENQYIYQAFKSEFAGYSKFYFIDYRNSITDINGVLATDAVRQNILKEWADVAHPNNTGSNRIFRYLSSFLLDNKSNVDINEINKTNINSLVSSDSTILEKAIQSISFGYKNTAKNPQSIAMGTCANNLNSAVVFGESNISSKVKQFGTQIKNVTTTNNTPTQLKDPSITANFALVGLTTLLLKGYVTAYNITDGTHTEFELDAKIIAKNDGTLEIVGGDYPTVTKTKGSDAVSVAFTNSYLNFYINVTGLTGKTIHWVSRLDFVEITTGF